MTTDTPLRYPETRREDVVDVLHGVEVPDPYRWLEDLDGEDTRRWIEAQNELTFGWLGEIPERERIRRRFTELWDFEKFGAPIKRGGRYFFQRNDGLQNQFVLHWTPDLEAEPRVLLDPNTLSEDGTVSLNDYAVSEDGRYLAYGLSAAGSDWTEWRVREVESGRDLDDHLRWVKFSGAAWTHDGTGFFYSRYDEPAEGEELSGANYDQKLCYHRLGTLQSEDEVVYRRPDHREWGFSAIVTEDGRYLIIRVWQGTHRENDVFVRDLEAGGEVVEVLSGFEAGYDFVGNDGTRLYLLTDRDAPMGRLVAIDLERPDPGDWEEVIPERADSLVAVSYVGGRFVATHLHDAHHRIHLFERDGTPCGNVALPGIGTAYGFAGRQDDPETFFLFSGYTTPGTVYRLDVAVRETSVFRKPRVGFDPDDYVTRQVFYESRDGTRVPMFITHHRDVNLDGDAPTYLSGYGGFGVPVLPMFSVGIIVWMEMGGVFAQANLRGGGEYGKAWHEAGRVLRRQNVFDDFIAAAEWLIENGVTRTDRLGIGGGSNGGLLVGACMTQRPDLFGACLPSVGVLDMLRFHTWTIGWAWVSDYGSPEEEEEFRALLAYSPYHNLEPGTAYPATLICTGDHDDRVYPAHSFKYAAALQAAQGGDAPALIRVETRAGHGLGKPTEKIIEEGADRWAFLVRVLGTEPPDPV
jgi:prolyl oligopeptidase